MNIIGKRKIWYVISGIFMVVGMAVFLLVGLKPGLDFTGGSLIEVKGINSSKAREVLASNGFQVISIEESGETVKIKTGVLDEGGHGKLKEALRGAVSEGREYEEVQFNTVGPTVSKDISTKAYLSIVLALLVIIIYVAYSFRKASKYFASWKYGVCAVLAVFHDVIFVVGVFAVLGFLFNIEIDSLFVTALLTVVSFSVHDTIVIFDRIRENLRKLEVEDFSEIVNRSVVEMSARSINTSLVILFVLLALLLLGGETIRYFILAMFLGLLVGTYSSIFIASPFLVTWKNWEDKRARKEAVK